MVRKELQIENIIKFVKEIELLKDAARTAWTSGGRRESVAEHSWRLAMFALVLHCEDDGLDINKVLQMCLIHDLGEAYEGDIPATAMEDHQEKLLREERAVLKLLEPLDEPVKSRLLSHWREYNRGETDESRFVKALDKMETIIQHNQGKNPADFNYAFNLDYGRSLAMFSPLLLSLRKIIDEDTRKRANQFSFFDDMGF